MAGRPWTLRELDQLVEWRRQGISRQDIGVKLRRSAVSVKHKLQEVAPEYVCRVCGRQVPASDIAWSPNAQEIRCKDCKPGRVRRRIARLGGGGCTSGTGVPDRTWRTAGRGSLENVSQRQTRARMRGGGGMNVQTVPGERVIDIAVDRPARVAQLWRAFGSREVHGGYGGRMSLDTGFYRMPDTSEWLVKFDHEPQTMGKIVNDLMIAGYWEAYRQSMPRRTGRRPELVFTVRDLVHFVPRPLALALGFDTPHGGGTVTGGGSMGCGTAGSDRATALQAVLRALGPQDAHLADRVLRELLGAFTAAEVAAMRPHEVAALVPDDLFEDETA